MYDFIIRLSDCTINEANELLLTIEEISGKVKASIISPQGFTNIGDIMLVVSALGGGVIVREMARIIIAWINRHEHHQVRIGDLDITGYSAKEIEGILKEIQTK